MKRSFWVILTVLLCLSVLPASAWDEPDYLPWEGLPASLKTMPEGSGFVQALSGGDGYWYILTEAPEGSRTLYIYKASGGEFALQAQSAPLPEMYGDKPSILAGYASVTLVYSEALLYGFAPDAVGDWRLVYVQGENTYLCTRFWLLEQFPGESRLIYAENTDPRLSAFDPRLYPPDLESAAKTLNTAGYALVSNPYPADRLHLRAEPDMKAESKGKYYNGTPVKIEEDLGDWARVTVAGVEGYMMKQYLAAGDDMLGVLSAFPALFVKESLAGEPLNLYTAPDGESAVAGISYDRGSGRAYIIVIGIVGEDWVHVVTLDGMAGYMPSDVFDPGNG